MMHSRSCIQPPLQPRQLRGDGRIHILCPEDQPQLAAHDGHVGNLSGHVLIGATAPAMVLEGLDQFGGFLYGHVNLGGVTPNG